MKKAFRVSSTNKKIGLEPVNLPDIHFETMQMAETYIELMGSFDKEVIQKQYEDINLTLMDPAEVEVEDNTELLPDMPKFVLAMMIAAMSMEALAEIEAKLARLN